MRSNRSVICIFVLGVAAGLAAAGCAQKEAPAPAAAVETKATPVGGGKIPVTTASADARAEFMQGRDLAEKLAATDSIAHFEKAAALDPTFALAELDLAQTAPTGTGFFDHLHKAVALADKASNGEKLLILAAEAAANNDTAKQKGYLDQLVAAYPDDERAHFTMGAYYFGQQDFPKAIEHYKRAIEIAPAYSPAYNIIGYAYRQTGDFGDAEKAFQKYIELIPKDPNPYDSYAELLLKEGKFDDSIAQYRKALAIDPNFTASYQGIAADLLYGGKPGEAAAEVKKMAEKARNDGERRNALFAQAFLLIDGGKPARAAAVADEQYAVSEKTKDVLGMAGSLQLKGAILLEEGKTADAKAVFDRAGKMIEDSDLSPAVKENNRRNHHLNMARVALAKNDLAAAKAEAAEFQKTVAASNAFQVRLTHELAGRIALAEKDYDKALAGLAQANLQDPYNLYRQCQAYKGKGDQEKAKEACKQAADFNSLPLLNYAFVRTKAAHGAK